MSSQVAYLNGRWILAEEAAIPFTDAGFVQGVTVAEQLRTFGGKLFRLHEHLTRLKRSLEIVGVDVDRQEIGDIATRLAGENHSLIDSNDDLAVVVFVTPGVYPAFRRSGYANQSGPTIGVHSYPIPFHAWADKYEQGDRLVVTKFRQTPTDCWPAELKCRSRMHYFLADREARKIDPQARALMTDHDGCATEATTANLFLYSEREGLISPPRARILLGVSALTLSELAAKLGIKISERFVTAENVEQADEVLLCSTSPCVWSVTHVNSAPIGSGKPGPMAKLLLRAWSEHVGLDIAAQAKRFRDR